METTNKTFRSAFGNKYQADIIDKTTAINLIDEINAQEILRNLISKHNSNGFTYCYFNLETSQLEYFNFIGNTDLQEKEHRILLEEISGNLEEGLTIEDFLDDAEIKNLGDKEPWDYIKQLDDYTERLTDAWVFYYQGFNEENIKNQLDRVY